MPLTTYVSGEVLTALSLNDNFTFAAANPVATPSGLVAITPTSVAVGSGTATVDATGLITFTTVGTNLSINGCFSAAYDYYKVMFVCTNAAANTMNMRLRVAGTDSSATNYWGQFFYSTASTPASSNIYQTNWNFSTTGRTARSFTVDFLDPFKASATSCLGSGTETTAGTSGGILAFQHLNTAATSYDGFSMTLGGSTITGTLKIYGYSL